MATTEKVASGSNWHVPVWTAAGEICYKEKAECILCKKAYEENGVSWKGELLKETIGHLQSAGSLGQKTVVTAAHNACIRELLQEIDVHGKVDRPSRELAMSLNRATQPGPVSPGGVEQAQRHKPASLSSQSGESLRHVGCYPTVCRREIRITRGDVESVLRAPP